MKFFKNKMLKVQETLKKKKINPVNLEIYVSKIKESNFDQFVMEYSEKVILGDMF